jgi:methionyl aminopeptidase
MSVKIKTLEEIEKMRIVGRLAAEVLEMITPYVTAGISTGELNRICHNYIVNKQDAIPAPLNYHGFPASICTSINEVVCHGIPDDKQILMDGDIVNVDITVIKDGYHGDTSKTFMIGKVADEVARLVSVTEECLYEAIKILRPGIRLGEVGCVIQKLATKNGYGIVRDFCGHGIGKSFHEDPEVVHYGSRKTGVRLKEGMTFTIEPMINMGKHNIVISKKDGWTVTTKDKTLSAQFEHTLLITVDGCEVLTKRNNEDI